MNRDSRPSVDVLVPVLDEAEDLHDAIASMRAQSYQGPVAFYFIDGGSRDRTREIVREVAEQDPRFHLLENPAGRTPNALNIGFQAGSGDVVARMDAHTNYPVEYLELGVQRLERGDVAHVSGPQVAHGTTPWSRRIALALSTSLGTGGAGFRHATDDEIEVASGFTGLWRRRTLERHDGWDEDWPVNQDAELAARIRKDGGRLVCVPAMAADYVPRGSLGRLWRQYWRYGIFRLKTSGAHPETLRRSHLLPPAVVVTAALAVAAPAPLRRPARAGVALYLLACVAAGLSTRGRAPLRDAAAVPAVLVTMHTAWGLGFFKGVARFGIPAAALVRMLPWRS